MAKSPFFYNYNPPNPPPSYTKTLPRQKSVSDSDNPPSSHTLDTTSSHLLLKVTLSPLFKLAKYIGIFPIEINQDGVASFGFGQFSMLLYVYWLLVFIGLSAYYSPLYLKLMRTDTRNGQTSPRPQSIYIIAKYLFVCGQFLAAAATLLIIPRMARRTATLYNRLNFIIKTLGESGGGSSTTGGGGGGLALVGNFKGIYLNSRLAVFTWFAIVICSLYMWWKSFHGFFRKEFKYESELWTYYSVVSGALGLAVVIAGHVVPSFLFFALANIMRATYKSIHKRERPIGPPTSNANIFYVNNSTISPRDHLFASDLSILTLHLELFAKLNTLVNRLGEIFGRYLIIEMAGFFTAVLTNAFSVLTSFEQEPVNWDTTTISILINFLWFSILCETGEAVGREQQRCLKSLKTWIVGAGIGVGGEGMGSNDAEGKMLITTTLLDDEVRGVSAANYFRIKRTLATQVAGAIVMYLIVMLQFKSTG